MKNHQQHQCSSPTFFLSLSATIISRSRGITHSHKHTHTHTQITDNEETNPNNDTIPQRPEVNTPPRTATSEMVSELGPLPIFANEENRKLDSQIKKLTISLRNIKKDHTDVTSRVKVMQDHLHNVKQERLHLEKMVETRRKELDTENHLKQLSDREIGRSRQAIRQEKETRLSVQDRLNIVQNAIYKSNEALESFKQQMDWNQGQLEQWAMAAKQKEEDNLAMEKYTKADDAKIKELTLVLEKLSERTHSARQLLSDEITETQAKQIELDKTAEEFRRLHRERQELVQRWQESLDTMKKRDVEIAKAGEVYGEVLEEYKKYQAELDEVKENLEAQARKNKEASAKRDALERAQQDCRVKVQKNKNSLIVAEDKVEIVQSELQKASRDLVTMHSAVQAESELVEEKKRRLEVARGRYQKVKRVLESNRVSSEKAETRAQAAEDFLKEKEQDLERKIKDLENVKAKMFRMGQELFRSRKAESDMIAEISGSQASLKNLVEKIRRLDQQTLRQQEVIYNAEFQIQQLERKISRASGVRTDDEKKVLNARIEELKLELDTHEKEYAMLTTQSRKLTIELKNAERDHAEALRRKEILKEQIVELKLQSSSAEKELKEIQDQRDNAMVECDMLKLEGNNLKKALSSKASEVFTLENRKYQLEMSMQERKKEIDVLREVHSFILFYVSHFSFIYICISL